MSRSGPKTACAGRCTARPKNTCHSSRNGMAPLQRRFLLLVAVLIPCAQCLQNSASMLPPGCYSRSTHLESGLYFSCPFARTAYTVDLDWFSGCSSLAVSCSGDSVDCYLYPNVTEADKWGQYSSLTPNDAGSRPLDGCAKHNICIMNVSLPDNGEDLAYVFRSRAAASIASTALNVSIQASGMASGRCWYGAVEKASKHINGVCRLSKSGVAKHICYVSGGECDQP